MKKTMAMATAALLCLSVNAADLTVPSGTTHSVGSNEDYGTVTLEGGTVSLNAAQLKCQTVNATANSTIRFNTGKLAASSWDKYWFQPSSGSTLTLESVDGNDIYLDVGYQRHNFSTGAGTVATTGSGDIVVNSLKSGSDRMYLTFTAGNVTWGHSGNLRAVGQGGLRLIKGGTLPSGSTTGGIKLEGSTELYLESEANSQVNSIEGSVRSIGWSWLKFGNYKDGTFKNAPNVGGVCNVEKHGTGTTLTLDNTGFTRLDVMNGTVVATGGATTIKDLSMNADTTLNVIDTTFSATNSAALKGATTAVAVGASGVFDAVGGSDASFLLDSAGSVVKRGAGTWNVYGESPLSGRLHVAGGTVRFRYKVDCGAEQWWRMSITKQSGNPSPNPGELGLFAGSERINSGLSASSATTPSSLAAGTVMFPSGSPFRDTSAVIGRMFDDANSGLWGWENGPSSPTITQSDPSTWLTVVFRLASAQSSKVATAADVRNSYYTSYSNGLKVESSPNGEDGTWVERLNKTWEGSKGWDKGWIHGDSHLAFTNNKRDGTGAGSRGIAAGTVVRVDSGATLDMSLVKTSENVVSALELDAAVGGGTITDCAFAEQGTLNVVNATRGDLKTLALPLTVVRATGAANLANWKVVLNGVELRSWELRFANDTVTFVPPGAILVVF